MGFFRRKRNDDAGVTSAAPAPGAVDAAEPGVRADAPGSDAPAEAGARDEASGGEGGVESGPLDRSEVAGDDGYVDLGSLWLPAVPGLMLTMEVDESTGDVTAVRIHHDDSVLQLQAFAAPKSSGIWDEIREELVAGIEGQGGSVEVRPGRFGVDVLARVPGRGADGRTVVQPMLFVGVDGPRWFVRGVVSGPAASDAELAAPLLDLMRVCVVVRGDEPMGPRELLPLTLPAEQGEAAGDVGDGRSAADLNPFARGPEITETR